MTFWDGISLAAIIVAVITYFRVLDVDKKAKRTESKLKKHISEEHIEENKTISRMMSELIGKNCIINFSCYVDDISASKVACTIEDFDEEWVKISFDALKIGRVTRMIRVEEIETVEITDRKIKGVAAID